MAYHTVDKRTLQQCILKIVRRLVPLGAISLRALREELQLHLGMTLVHHKAEIRHVAEHAPRELTLEHQLVATGLCDGAWEPIPLDTAQLDQGRILFHSLGDYLSDNTPGEVRVAHRLAMLAGSFIASSMASTSMDTCLRTRGSVVEMTVSVKCMTSPTSCSTILGPAAMRRPLATRAQASSSASSGWSFACALGTAMSRAGEHDGAG